MPFPLALAGLGLKGGADLFKTIYGITQMFKGNNMYKDLMNNIPQYEVDPNIQYNLSLAKNIAQQGIPSQARNLYTENVERGLGSTIAAMQQGGGGLNMLNQAYQSSTDAFRNFMMQDAQQKLANQQAVIQAGKDVRDENLRAFQQNEMLPFQLKYQRSNQLSNAGSQNIFGGMSGLGNTAFGFEDLFGSNVGGKDMGTSKPGGQSSGFDWAKFLQMVQQNANINYQFP
jgi:hypothetical protein